MKRGQWGAIVALVVGCKGGPSREPSGAALPRDAGAHDGATPAVDAGAVDVRKASLDAGAGARPAVLEEGKARVFFAKRKGWDEGIALQELYVVREGAKAHVVLDDDDPFDAVIEADGRLRRIGTPPAEPLVLTPYDDGSFAGEVRYKDGSTSTWERHGFVPVGPELDGQSFTLAGFLAATTRYRVKLALRGNDLEGIARYPTTREDLRLRGKIDRANRTIDIDELDGAGRVTGKLTGVFLGHQRAAEYRRDFALRGSWQSPDGKRHLPMSLTIGFYPERVVRRGISLSAQERYERDCDLVTEYVWPVVGGAPTGVAEKIESRVKGIVLQGLEPGPPPAEAIAALRPGTSVKKAKCKKDDPEARGTTSGIYSAVALRDAFVAIEVEHYAQQGSISGNVWHDCIVVDLATGEVLEPNKLLDTKTRDALTRRAKRQLTPPPGPNDFREQTKAAVDAISLADAPLCIGEKTVRVMLTQHRVFGPGVPEWSRDELASLLPPGKLRELVTPIAK